MELTTRVNAGEALGNRILKVNHAGEHGAVNIYAGQRWIGRWTAPDLLPQLAEFQQHEQGHRALFAEEIGKREVRRCRRYYFCGAGGFLLGCVSALCGRAAIAATTVAVERVVLGHLDQQITVLRGHDDVAAGVISKIVAEEREHHDSAKSQLPATSFWVKVFTPVVAISTELVIWLGMHL